MSLENLIKKYDKNREIWHILKDLLKVMKVMNNSIFEKTIQNNKNEKKKLVTAEKTNKLKQQHSQGLKMWNRKRYTLEFANTWNDQKRSFNIYWYLININLWIIV